MIYCSFEFNFSKVASCGSHPPNGWKYSKGLERESNSPCCERYEWREIQGGHIIASSFW